MVWPTGKKSTTRSLGQPAPSPQNSRLVVDRRSFIFPLWFASPARVWKVLTMMHEALVNEEIVTKRDIYYKDTQLFGTQAVVDRVRP